MDYFFWIGISLVATFITMCVFILLAFVWFKFVDWCSTRFK